jgi:hypothetical protein
MTMDFMLLKLLLTLEVLWLQPAAAASATNMAAIGTGPRVKIRIRNFRFPLAAGLCRFRAKSWPDRG